ncbi:hypothetical protein ACF0H5_022830 [Mactra antiquata]
MGLVAPFIVKEPSGDSMEQILEHITVIQDCHNVNTGDYLQMDIRLGPFLPDRTMLPRSPTVDGYYRINILNMGNLALVHHPIHIHGYSFHVVKIGYGELQIDNIDVNCHTDEQKVHYATTIQHGETPLGQTETYQT